jgi:tetratricopeptide (TPR) repeat protein
VKAYTLSYQEDNAGAIAAYDEAIAALPSSGDAHYERATLLYTEGKNDEALAGFAAARAAGYDVSSVDSWQSYLYLVVGDTANARLITEAWAQREPSSPSALGALIAVAAAEQDPAAVAAASKALRDSAQATVAAVRANGNEPDEDFFYAIEEAADIIAELRDREPVAGAPERSAEQTQAIDAAIADARSLETTLAFQLTPSTGTLQALTLGTKDDSDTFSASEAFDNTSFDGIPLTIQATAAGITAGASVIVKFYADGYEDESLRYVGTWDQASDGTVALDVPIDLGPSYVLPEGDYAVEVYIDGTLQGARMPFVVE